MYLKSTDQVLTGKDLLTRLFGDRKLSFCFICLKQHKTVEEHRELYGLIVHKKTVIMRCDGGSSDLDCWGGRG